MVDEAAEFWSKFEEETGEKVEARGMGQWFETEDDDSGHWGLLILTDRSFRFKHMPSESWLSSLFRGAGKRKGPSKPLDITVPRGDILALEEPSRSFLSKIVGPAYEVLRLTWRSEEGEKSGRFAMEPRCELRTALKRAVGKA